MCSHASWSEILRVFRTFKALGQVMLKQHGNLKHQTKPQTINQAEDQPFELPRTLLQSPRGQARGRCRKVLIGTALNSKLGIRFVSKPELRHASYMVIPYYTPWPKPYTEPGTRSYSALSVASLKVPIAMNPKLNPPSPNSNS